MVICEALPDYGLRPRHPGKGVPGVPRGRTNHWTNYWNSRMNDWWSDDEEDAFRYDYVTFLKDATEEIRDPVVPLNLLQVSKSVATMTRSIYDNGIPFVINIASMCLHILDRIVNENKSYPGPNIDFPIYTDDLHHLPHFKQLRNFELDLAYDPIWWREYFEEKSGPSSRKLPWVAYHPDSPGWRKPIKEYIQIICDVLSKNQTIDRLTIRLPTLCSLQTPELVAKAEIAMLDTLAPLRKLRVDEDVKFIWLHKSNTNFKEGIRRRGHVCYRKSLGEDLLKTLQGKFKRLDGENSGSQLEA
ncbi:MAG: hypothetical protein Q9226_008724 [Calogaya cf. arnoldii]